MHFNIISHFTDYFILHAVYYYITLKAEYFKILAFNIKGLFRCNDYNFPIGTFAHRNLMSNMALYL